MQQVERRRRLVRITSVLLVSALIGLVPLALLLSVTDDSGTVLPAALGLIGLLGCYLLVLSLVRAEHTGAARAALFTGWLLYLNAMLPLARPFLALPWFEFMVLLAATMFFAISMVGVVTLEGWPRARGWVLVFPLSYALNSLLFAPTAADELAAYGVGRGLGVGLLLGVSVVVLTLARDLSKALASLAAQLEREQGLRVEAQRARAEAERSEQAKGRFLAQMSHEIRTPMNSVLGLSELVLDSSLDREQRERITVVYDSARGLLTVINDILAFSRADAVGIELAPAPTDLRALIDSIAELLRERARANGLELEVFVSELPAWVAVDSGRLRQVLINLLSNAIKFTSEGRIELSCYCGEGRVRFEVSDTGIGIAESQLDRLFEPFAQADESINRKYGGTGLGLAISAQLVEAMGGHIEVDSTLGAGTRVAFNLELAPVPAPASEDREKDGDEREGADEPRRWKPEREREPEPEIEPEIETEEAVPVFRGCVLLVDDNSINRMVGEAMLGALGWEVDLVSSGREALAAVRARDYALILLDCQMPDWDGFRTVTELHRYWQESERASTPIAALTAHATAGYRELCLSRGMDDYLAKPLSKAALAELFMRWELGQTRQ